MSLDPPNVVIRPLCGNGTITISFSPPANSSESIVSYYIISDLEAGSGQLNVYPPSTFYTYTGLTNGQEYTPYIAYFNTSTSETSPTVYYRTVQPGVQSDPPIYNTVIPIAPSTAISVVITPSNVDSAQAKWLLTTMIDPTTGAQQVFTEYPNVDPVQQQFKYMPNLTKPWYRFYSQAANDAGKSYQPPGISNLNYYNFPQQYNDSSSTLQFWFDASMMTRYTNNNSLNFNNVTLSNYAIPTSYTLYSVGNALSQNDFPPTVNKYSITLGAYYGNVYSPEITYENQLSNDAFTLFYVARQANSVISGTTMKVLQSRWSPSQYIGFDDLVDRVCQMDDTPFVTDGVVSDAAYKIISLSRNGSSGRVSFGWNGSTISTSGTVLSTLNDIAFCQEAYSNGLLAELIYYSKELPMSNQQSLEGYLAWKWGLNANLPPNHPYYTSPP